jgi:alpha-1,6-mannosyltransferase
VKIVDVSGFYSELGGGVRSYVRQKLEAAARLGHEVTIVAPGARHHVERRDGGKIVWVASPPMPFDANYRMFWRSSEAVGVLEQEQPDVVEGSSTWRGGWIAARWRGAAVKALVFHQDFVAAYAHTLLDARLSHSAIDRLFAPYWRHVARLSRHFDVTIAGGEWLAARLSAFAVHNPVAIPLGVEPGRFSHVHRDEGLRRDLLERCGIGPDGVLLLAVGRFHPEKRHGVILDGFAKARRAHPGLGLVLIGDGLRRGAVAKAAARVGNVHLLGSVPDRAMMARLYASADLLVHGSGAETYGLVVAEAICSGLPVVVPDSGGASDFAPRARSAVYPTGDGDACAAAILRLVASAGPVDGDTALNRDGSVRSADAHFVALFGLYQRMIERRADVTRVGRASGDLLGSEARNRVDRIE